MNQINIDYLSQITPLGGDRPSPPMQADRAAFGFNEHLSHASASVFELVSPPNRDTMAASKPSRDDLRVTASYRSDSSTSAPRPAESQPLRATKPEETAPPAAANDTAASEAADAAPQSDEEESNPGSDDDQYDNEQASVAAAMAQPSKAKPGQPAYDSDANGIPSTNSKLDAAANVTTKNNDQATPAVRTGEDIENVAFQGTAFDASALGTQQDEIGETTSADRTEVAESDGKQSARTSPLGERAHAEKTRRVDAAKSTSGDDASAVAISSAIETTTASGIEVAQDEQTTAKTTKSAVANKSDDTTSDDASTADQNKTTDGHPRPNMLPINISSTTAVASNIAAATTLANGEEAKGDSESATKPISARPESAVGPLGRAMRSTPDVTRPSGTSNTHDGPQIDPSRFVGRVAKAFQTANERGGTMQIRLAPPELGALKIQLTIKDGVMSANLETDNANARRLLLDHLPALRDRLAEQNIRMERFDVDVRQEHNGRQANAGGSNHNPYQQQAEQADNRRGSPRAGRTNDLATTSDATPVIAAKIGTTEINLVV